MSRGQQKKKSARPAVSAGSHADALARSEKLAQSPFLEQPFFHFAAIILLGLLGYSKTFQAPFFFDDSTNIFWNPIIKELDNFFFSTEAYRYNPRRFIGYLSFALNYKFGGHGPFGYHAVNLCIHIVNALLVYLLLALTARAPFFEIPPGGNQENDKQRARLAAFFAGLLFVSHPLATQSVTYIVQRYTSLATMFYLLSLVCYIKARFILSRARLNVTAGIFFILSLLAAVFGMKTKEIAFTLPFVLFLYEVSFFRGAVKKRFLFLLALLLILAVIPLSVVNMGRPPGGLLAEIDAGTRIGTSMPRWDYLMTQLRVIVTYIRLFFQPISQNLDYDYPLAHSLFSPDVFASFLLIAGLTGAGFYLYRLPRADFSFLRLTGFGILWFFITLSVESSIIPIADVIFEHRTYLPSVGAFAAIASCCAFVFNRGASGREKGYLLALAVALLLTGATFARNLVWQSEISLWEDVVRKSPGKARARNNLGIAYLAGDHVEKATREFEAALAIDPGNSEAYSNLAMAYSAKGQKQEALIFLERAVAADPENALALSNLGNLYEKSGELEKAKEKYLAAVGVKPDIFLARKNLGGLYLKLGELDAAVRELRRAVALNPDSAGAFYNLGIAFLQKENIAEAVSALRQAVLLQPDYSEAHNNLGVAYIREGDVAQALVHFRTAVSQDPGNATARNNFNQAQSLLQKQD